MIERSLHRLKKLAGLTHNNKYKLNEHFDSAYPYYWTMDTAASFKTRDGGGIDMFFYVDGKNRFEFEFERDGKTKTSHEGDQFKIFSNVIKIIEDFIKKHPKLIRLEFDAEPEKGSDDNKRYSLYRQMLKRFAEKYGFNIKENERFNEIQFVLIMGDKQ